MINKIFYFRVLLLALLFMLGLPTSVLVNTNRVSGDVPVYFFWGDGCPHCAAEEPFLESLAQKYPQVKIQKYEVWYNTANQEILKKVADLIGFDPNGVPVTMIGEKYWIGYSEEYSEEMESAVKGCVFNTCKSLIDAQALSTPADSVVQKNSNLIITLPFIGGG